MAITDTEFHRLADEMFAEIENAVEKAIDEQDADVDINASGNVLQLAFEDGSQIVINKQEPLHEIWLATKSGGYHFNYNDEKWLDTRNGLEFMPFVIDAINKQSGIVLKINP
ncbi:MAG: iron donor protein CyaY [Shewanella psychromarinicola]|jgi:CyaY protein|uniref:Iron-sulfur cluster assembly protein CyaY n=1 Tax=Shewanella psychromarinicola TaxID=2487742 RepID=A0A3N4DAL8_9GAMM|nr:MULTISPECIES: iron donor protein CyaY [Shewanella]AZG33841.1 iron donor protein CyaY [Shewanella psychromarinicola]MCL1083473.1 iron donor protein CyaY [Shewanella psychromarinicola]PKG78868.1 iron donor protein CyaY [Shewanella sp. Actino-trap-3]RPA22923.1 iron donor protein CyaY [Shewanella psychromarinicola]|tara:strand:+ start:50310 stop:50645 length:336 start_codon:yes stop_codon:yes gene_type:complete